MKMKMNAAMKISANLRKARGRRGSAAGPGRSKGGVVRSPSNLQRAAAARYGRLGPLKAQIGKAPYLHAKQAYRARPAARRARRSEVTALLLPLHQAEENPEHRQHCR